MGEPSTPQRLPRPRQIENLAPDQLVAAVLRLTMEVSVLRERLATHELLLGKAGLMNSEEVNNFAPDAGEAQRRSGQRTQLIEQIISDLSP